MSKPNCPKCNSTQLVRRFQRSYIYEQPILKNGKFSKRHILISDVSYSEPEWIYCEDCLSEFDYVVENGKLEILGER